MCWSGLEQIFTQPIKEHLFSWTSRPLQDPVTLMLYLDPSIISFLPLARCTLLYFAWTHPIDPNADSFDCPCETPEKVSLDTFFMVGLRVIIFFFGGGVWDALFKVGWGRGRRVREQMWAHVKFNLRVWACGKPTFIWTPACLYIAFETTFL